MESFRRIAQIHRQFPRGYHKQLVFHITFDDRKSARPPAKGACYSTNLYYRRGFQSFGIRRARLRVERGVGMGLGIMEERVWKRTNMAGWSEDSLKKGSKLRN